MSTTNPQNITTEWDELQIKFGNYSKPETPVPEYELEKISQEQFKKINPYDLLSDKKLQEKIEETNDDFLLSYRKKRMQALLEQQNRNRFSFAVKISKETYTDEVTKSSSSATVLCVIIKSDQSCSADIIDIFERLAVRHPYVKICIGEARTIIPNFPEEKLPAVLIYQKNNLVKQVLGREISQNNDFNYKNVESYLIKIGIYRDPNNLDEDDQDDSESEKVSSAVINTGANDKAYTDSIIEQSLRIIRK